MKHHTDQFIVHAAIAWQENAIDLHFGFRQRETGHFYEAQPMVFASVSEGQTGAPAMRLTKTDAQILIDELWRCGLRPTEGTGSAGSLAATERHLADMKKVAFDLLAMVKP